MNINATIFGQMLTFSIFVWVNKKFIWPKLLRILNERENKISQGLQAAELAHKELEASKILAKQKELETKQYCNALINDAKKKAEQIIEESITQATHQKHEIINNAYLHIETEKYKLQQALQQNVANLIICSIEKIMPTYLNQELHQRILTDINHQLYDN